MKWTKKVCFRFSSIKSSINKIVNSNIQHMCNSNWIDVTLNLYLRYLFYFLSFFLFTFNKFSQNVCDLTSKSMHKELQITFNNSFENESKIELFLEIKFCFSKIFLKNFDFVDTL
jgi:hypothetical protein